MPHLPAGPLTLPFQADRWGCSQDGAKAASEHVARQCLILLTAYAQHGPLNDRQAEELTGIKDTTICARRSTLLKRGLIEAVGKAKTASGVLNMVYDVTDRGRRKASL